MGAGRHDRAGIAVFVLPTKVYKHLSVSHAAKLAHRIGHIGDDKLILEESIDVKAIAAESEGQLNAEVKAVGWVVLVQGANHNELLRVHNIVVLDDGPQVSGHVRA